MAGANTGSAGKPNQTHAPIKASGVNTGSAGKPASTRPAKPPKTKK